MRDFLLWKLVIGGTFGAEYWDSSVGSCKFFSKLFMRSAFSPLSSIFFPQSAPTLQLKMAGAVGC